MKECCLEANKLVVLEYIIKLINSRQLNVKQHSAVLGNNLITSVIRICCHETVARATFETKVNRGKCLWRYD